MISNFPNILKRDRKIVGPEPTHVGKFDTYLYFYDITEYKRII